MGTGWGLLVSGLVVAIPLWRVGPFVLPRFPVAMFLPPSWVLQAGGLLAVCVWVWSRDRWVALLGAYLLLRAIVQPVDPALPMSLLIIAGMALYAIAQGLSTPWTRRVRFGAMGVGGLQVLVVAAHAWGFRSVAHGEWAGGTLGNPNYVGAFLAIAASWCPPWLLPFWAVGVMLTKSALAALAFVVVLVLRYGSGKRLLWSVPACLAVFAGTWWLRGPNMLSWVMRAALVRFGLSVWILHCSWWVKMFGLGVGSWWRATAKIPGESVFGEAHNEFLQLGFEGGLMALALLGACLWAHRSDFSVPQHAALLGAVVVESLGMFPFRVTSVAVVALTGLGFCTRGKDLTHG